MFQIDSIKTTDIQSAARRALMSAHPDYFSWTECEQENFRASKDEQAIQRIKVALINNLFGLRCDLTDVDDVWDDLPTASLDVLNWAQLLTDGVGNDNIFLNENFATDKSILDFNTLYDYDFDDHLFQEASRKKRSSNYEPRNYYPFRWEPWVRLLINNVFFYANLSAIGRYITDELDDFGFNYIEQLIPHEFVEGKDHGKPNDKDWLQWDMQINAAGLEGHLEELKSRWNTYLENRFTTISAQQVGEKPSLYIVDDTQKQVTNRTYIFNNEDALKNVRWKHFLSDCKPLVQDDDSLKILLQTELKDAQHFLNDAHKDIMKHFDPKVVKLKKKMKVVMPSELLDKLDDQD